MCTIRINNPRPLATFNHICYYKDINKAINLNLTVVVTCLCTAIALVFLQ